MKPITVLSAVLFLLAAFGCARDESSPLAMALSDGKTAEAIALLDEGADPNTEFRGVPVLYWALLSDDMALADKLAEKGAELDMEIDGKRVFDELERTANSDPKDKGARKALDWLSAHGVKRHP